MSDIGMACRVGTKTSYGSCAARGVPWRALTKGKGATAVIGLFLFTLIGLIVAIYPSATAIALVATTAVVVILSRCYRKGIETWQIITLACLTGYIVLNYGFENLSIPLGPLQFLPVGELFMGVALALAVFRYHGLVFRGALQNAPVLYTLALLLLTIIHLAVDVPNYGLYALRDSTSSFEAVFLILGMLWANQERNIELLTKWLMLLFIAATIYTYTFPWADQLENWSVTSGPFHPVALLGNYQELAVYLLAGALFCIWVAPSISAWPLVSQYAGHGAVDRAGNSAVADYVRGDCSDSRALVFPARNQANVSIPFLTRSVTGSTAVDDAASVRGRLESTGPPRTNGYVGLDEGTGKHLALKCRKCGVGS
jgi:hypothetical protein